MSWGIDWRQILPWTKPTTLDGYGIKLDRNNVILSDPSDPNKITKITAEPSSGDQYILTKVDPSVSTAGYEYVGLAILRNAAFNANNRKWLKLGYSDDAGLHAIDLDYAINHFREMGNFTPSMVNGNWTYTTQLGRYYRAGYMCFFMLNIKGTTTVRTGELLITGFPFPMLSFGLMSASGVIRQFVGFTSTSFTNAKDITVFAVNDQLGLTYIDTSGTTTVNTGVTLAAIRSNTQVIDLAISGFYSASF